LVEQEFQIRTPDGSFLPVLASVVPVRSESGEPLGAIVVARDVSVQKERERLRAEWAALVAHDLRQPVSGVAFAVDLARKAHPGPLLEPEAKQLGRIEGAAGGSPR
jgi:signal transduction histidine kinase